ncbi:MAG: GNAT family N-acetyltransferase [Actinomycetota bacterium]
MTTRLETPRLIIRPFTLRDLDQLTEIFAQPEVMRFIGDGPISEQETLEWLERWMPVVEATGYGHHAVTLRGSGTLIGRCGPVERELSTGREIEISYLLARERWGCGYATEAAAAVRDYGLGELGQRRLVSLIAHGNSASEGVAKRIGMLIEGSLEFHGRPCNVWAIHAAGGVAPDDEQVARDGT